MMRTRITFALALSTCAALLAATTARADTWNERTELTFSEAVMVPGATLAPGKYLFKLLDSRADRHTVQVFRLDAGEQQLVITTQAVPIKRADAKGDTVLRFAATAPGTAPAMKAWFYPGSIYGHQFVYADDQARHISARIKTVVLAGDGPGGEVNVGTLHVYDATGARQEWRPDAAVMTEWQAWRQQHAVATGGAKDTRGTQSGNAHAMEASRTGMRVDLDDLEDYPSKYIGQTVSVDAEVQDVYGPRLFTIDEPHWVDLDGELLVHVPTAMAAIVREGDRVTISGEVKAFSSPALTGEWGWRTLDADTEAELRGRTMLDATRIIGGDQHMAYVIGTDPARVRAEGQRHAVRSTLLDALTSRGDELTRAGEIASGDDDLVGRRVRLSGQRVADLNGHGGFYLETDDGMVFVLPADRTGTTASVGGGDTVAVDGVVLKAPRGLGLEGDVPEDANDDIYVLATAIRR